MEPVFKKLPGSGRGAPRPGVKQSPTARQPNRGRKPGDPFTCVGCRLVFPAEKEYFLGRKPQGRCVPCGKDKRSSDHADRMIRLRGPVEPSKDERFPVIDGNRECSECGDILAVSEFYTDRSVQSGLQNVCKVCRRGQRNARWHGLSPEDKALMMEEQWRQRIWHRYHLSPETYDVLLAAQDGVCAICRTLSNVRLAVDHDHLCCPGEYTCGGCIRQLLCQACNASLGGIERVGTIDPFADYLQRHSGIVRLTPSGGNVASG